MKVFLRFKCTRKLNRLLPESPVRNDTTSTAFSHTNLSGIGNVPPFETVGWKPDVQCTLFGSSLNGTRRNKGRLARIDGISLIDRSRLQPHGAYANRCKLQHQRKKTIPKTDQPWARSGNLKTKTEHEPIFEVCSSCLSGSVSPVRGYLQPVESIEG